LAAVTLLDPLGVKIAPLPCEFLQPSPAPTADALKHGQRALNTPSPMQKVEINPEPAPLRVRSSVVPFEPERRHRAMRGTTVFGATAELV